MRYLTLSADYGQFQLQEGQTGGTETNDLGLPQDLIADLVAWNERYQAVVTADSTKRAVEPLASLIRDLDDAGMRLAERIAAALPQPAKVSYYSEGLLRRVP